MNDRDLKRIAAEAKEAEAYRQRAAEYRRSQGLPPLPPVPEPRRVIAPEPPPVVRPKPPPLTKEEQARYDQGQMPARLQQYLDKYGTREQLRYFSGELRQNKVRSERGLQRFLPSRLRPAFEATRGFGEAAIGTARNVARVGGEYRPIATPSTTGEAVGRGVAGFLGLGVEPMDRNAPVSPLELGLAFPPGTIVTGGIAAAQRELAALGRAARVARTTAPAVARRLVTEEGGGIGLGGGYLERGPGFPRPEPLVPPGQIEPAPPALPRLPRELAGAKPRFNIRTKSYLPEFESDLDKALYILAQVKRSNRDADYLAFAQRVLPGRSEAELRALGGLVRRHIRDTVSGQPSGAYRIPGFVQTPIRPSVQPAPIPGQVPGSPEAGIQADIFGGGKVVEPKGKGVPTQVGMDDALKLQGLQRQAQIEAQEAALFRAREELKALQAPGIRAPKFGTAEHAEYDAAGRAVAEAGRPGSTKAKQVAAAKARVQRIETDLDDLRAGREPGGVTGGGAPPPLEREPSAETTDTIRRINAGYENVHPESGDALATLVQRQIREELGSDPIIRLYRGIRPGGSLPTGKTWPESSKRVFPEGPLGEYWTTSQDQASLYARLGGEVYQVDLKASELANRELTNTRNIDPTEFHLSPQLQRRGVKSRVPPVSPAAPPAGPAVPPSPPQPPPTPSAQPPPPSAALPQMERIITQSQEIVAQDRPKAISAMFQKIPGVRQVREAERPGLKMTGENEKVLVAHVAETGARSDVAAQVFPSRVAIGKQLEAAFGRKAMRGGKVDVPFLGTAAERAHPITGKLKDIADNPDLYQLAPAQTAALVALDNRNTGLLKYVVEGYGAEVGRYQAKPGGAFLSTVDIAEDVLEALGSETRAVARGRGKTRLYPSARERMTADPTFKPELDVDKLLDGMDRFKASAAAGETFRKAVGGLNRLEVMEKTHPALAAKMLALRKRVSNLQGLFRDLNREAADAIDDFIASPLDDVDLLDLQDALNPGVVPGRYVAKASPYVGMTTRGLKAEINKVKAEIAALRPAWKGTNLKPYEFVQEGIYRYFPVKQANMIRELRKVSDNPFLNFLEGWRGGAFSGDFSPILGVQTPLGALFDPLGQFEMGAGAVAKAVQERNIFRSFSVKALAEDVVGNEESWRKFFSLQGRAPTGTPSEFAGGYLRVIPGFSQFTEATFIAVTRQSHGMWERMVRQLVKDGVPELVAEVAAMRRVTEVFPLISPARLGQSPARQALLRALPTSYSFIRQPANLIGTATLGYAKLGLRQELTPGERLAVRLMTTLAGSIAAVSVTSAAISAKARGEDVKQAALDALNPAPSNGKFASVVIGSRRVPIGGPYRAIFRALTPRKISGVPVPVPLGGLPQYIRNRLNPAVGTQLDLYNNEDYFGEAIRKGAFPQQMMQSILYEIEGVLPLTLGTVMQGVRTGEDPGQIAEEAVGQFTGANVIPRTAWQAADVEFRKTYGKSLLDANIEERRQFNEAHPEMAARITEERRGVRGEALRTVKTIEVERDQKFQALNQRFEGRLTGDSSTAEAFKDQYRAIKEEARIRRIQVFKDLGVFQDEQKPEEIKDPGDRALVQLYRLFEAPVGAGGAKRPDGSTDWDVLEEIEGRLRATWSPEQRAYVDRQEPQEYPGLVGEYAAHRRELRDAGWYDLARNIPLLQRNPKMLELLESYQEAKREGNQDAWEQSRGAEFTILASKLEGVVDLYKQRIRQKKPTLDIDFVRFEGSTPRTIEAKAYFLAQGGSPLRVLTKGELGNRLSAQERLGLEQAGLTTLAQISGASHAEIAQATGHRLETVQAWGLQDQAQGIQDRSLVRATQ